jgi:hypothetical protein
VGVRRTAVAGNGAAVEFFGEDHGCVAEIDAVVLDGLTEGELA